MLRLSKSIAIINAVYFYKIIDTFFVDSMQYYVAQNAGYCVIIATNMSKYNTSSIAFVWE